MLDTLFASAVAEALTLSGTLAVLGASLALGLFISLVYMATHDGDHSTGFTVTLIMLPAIISIIILLVGSNIARAFSLAGAFSLIRFRSAPGDPKDIAYVFFTLGVGLACGMGYIGYAALFAVILCGVMAALHYSGFGKPKAGLMQLKITVPENLNFQGAFDDILANYASSYQLKKIASTDFGTLFDVVYLLRIRPEADQKQLIDELRCRNGNLNISLTLRQTEEGFAI